MANIIEARVRQKVDTLEEWNNNPLILLGGEQAVVLNSNGLPVNIKYGDGTKRFSDLPFWIKYDQAAYSKVTTTVLPLSDGAAHYSIVGSGTYTQTSGGVITVPDGSLGIISNNGTTWSLDQTVVLPTDSNVIRKDSILYYIGKNKLNINEYIDNVSIDTNGGLTNSVGSKTSTLIDISSFSSIVISNINKALWNGGHRYRLLDSAGVYISGTVNQLIASQTPFVITRPNNCKYIQYVFARTGEVADAYNKTQIEGGSISTPYEQYVKEVIGVNNEFIRNSRGDFAGVNYVDDRLLLKADELNDDGKVVRSTFEIQRDYTNVEGVIGAFGSGFYRYDSGLIVASAERKTTLFTIEPNKKYAISGIVNGASIVSLVVYFDSQMQYLGYQERVQSGTVTFDRFILTIPTGTMYIGTGNNNATPAMVLESYTESIYYKEVLYKGDVIKDKSINPIYKESLLLFGTSITRGNQNGNVGYGEIIASMNEMTVVNRAVGGATLAITSAGTNNICKQVDDYIASVIANNIEHPKYIILDGLTNDISSNVPLGVITTGYYDTYDKTTVLGSFEYIIKTLKGFFIKSAILYNRVHKMGSRTTSRQNEWGDKLIEGCKKWSIPYADIYNEGSLNTYLDDQALLYTTPTVDQPNGDRTHPNTLGYRYGYVPIITTSLRKISLDFS